VLDFIVRSITTSAITLILTLATVHDALHNQTPPSWLLTAAAVSWSFYFGNHFVQNGKVIEASKIVTQMNQQQEKQNNAA
jgi:hypothetical protein